MVHVDALSRLPLNISTDIEDDYIIKLCITASSTHVGCQLYWYFWKDDRKVKITLKIHL